VFEVVCDLESEFNTGEVHITKRGFNPRVCEKKEKGEREATLGGGGKPQARKTAQGAPIQGLPVEDRL